MAALVIAWQAIHDAHTEMVRSDEDGAPVPTGLCADCGRPFPCGPHRMAAQKLRDTARRGADDDAPPPARVHSLAWTRPAEGGRLLESAAPFEGPRP